MPYGSDVYAWLAYKSVLYVFLPYAISAVRDHRCAPSPSCATDPQP
ncbi:hypothetical protein T261_3695 [Streptomyces lydicus]|nr:hypothetical protein T261_3695 [Streptomyces lydicus]